MGAAQEETAQQPKLTRQGGEQSSSGATAPGGGGAGARTPLTRGSFHREAPRCSPAPSEGLKGLPPGSLDISNQYLFPTASTGNLGHLWPAPQPFNWRFFWLKPLSILTSFEYLSSSSPS